MLAVVEAPRPTAYVAMIQAQKHQKNRSATPRFDRTGFPMDPKDHAARRDRLRSRVMTTTVVATVVAAPVIALWSAYRGAPLTGEGHDGSGVTATGTDTGAADDPYDHYENAGNARPESGPRFTDGAGLPDVSAEVIGSDTGPGADKGRRGAGRLTVEARSSGSTTLITLTASKKGPVSWSAATGQAWLRLSSSSGKPPRARASRSGSWWTMRAHRSDTGRPASPSPRRGRSWRCGGTGESAVVGCLAAPLAAARFAPSAPARPGGAVGALPLPGSHGALAHPDGTHPDTVGHSRSEPVPGPVRFLGPGRPGQGPEHPAAGRLTDPATGDGAPRLRRGRGRIRRAEPTGRPAYARRARSTPTAPAYADGAGSAGCGAIGSSEESRSSHSSTSRAYASLPISSVSSGR